MEYAYDVAGSVRDNLVPNLKLAAQKPWMGLTAYVGGRPHLIIAKNGEAFVMEDEYGQIREADFTFDWEEPKHEVNRLVAASRTSHLKSAGLLAYDPDNGEWAIRVGTSNMRYPLEEAVEDLERHGWQLTSVVDKFDPDVIDAPGKKEEYPTIKARAACPHCHSDQHLEPLTDDDADEHSGKEKMYACHNCGKWAFEHELEVSDHDKDLDENNNDVDYEEDADGPERHQAPKDPRQPKKESAIPLAFSFQGAVVIKGHGNANGIALKPEEQSNEEMLQMINGLESPQEQMDTYVNQQNREHGTSFPRFDNPFINRGGSRIAAPGDPRPEAYMPRTTPSYPEEFPGGGFILAAKWLTPEHTAMFLQEGRGSTFRGIITSSGGATSHAVVVAQGESIPCIITDHENVERIQPGDHLQIEANGVVHVNGGDPNFVSQDPSQIKAKTALYRWAWSKGYGKAARIDPNDINRYDTLHPYLMTELMNEGHLDFMDATVGYIYDDGSVDIDTGNPITDEDQLVAWLHQFGESVGLPITKINKVNIQAYALGPGGVVHSSVKLADTVTAPYPGGQGIHNGTSGLFSQAGLQATVTLPDGPTIQLPFTAPNTFMIIMKWKMADYPSTHGGASPEGAPMTVDSDNTDMAIHLIQQASGAHTGSVRTADDEDGPGNLDHLDQALKCPQCDSHTLRAIHKDEEKGKAEFLCNNCGNVFKADYRKHAGAEHPKGTRVEVTHPAKRGIKGTILEHKGQDKDLGDHLYHVQLDNGDELKECSEIHLKKIKSASTKIADSYNSAADSIGYPTDPEAQRRVRDLLAQIVQAKQSGNTQEVYTLQDQLSQLLTQAGQAGGTSYNMNPPSNPTYAHYANDEFSINEPPKWFVDRLDQEFSDWIMRESGMQKGAPYPENSYKNSPDHSPKGQEWPKEVNAVYNACMREGNGRGDSKDDKQSSCARIAWAQYKKTQNKKGEGDTEKESSFTKEAYVKEVAGFVDNIMNGLSHLHASGAMRKLMDAAVNPANPLSYIDDIGAGASGAYSGNQDQNKQSSIDEFRELLPSVIKSIVDGTPDPEVLAFYNKISRAKPINNGQGIDADWLGKGYEGHPVMCYMCGNERTASLGSRCEHCGYVLTVRRDAPPKNNTAFVKSAALNRGEWYTMYSPEYKVPDVIQVLDINDQGVTAAIEGDDKGVFPISFTHEEIEKQGYRFEPYSSGTAMGRAGNYFLEGQDNAPTQKEARRQFTIREQQELINENLEGRARNINKLDLEGTHYKGIEASVDPLKFVDDNPLWFY